MGEDVLGGLQYLFLVYLYSFPEGLRNSNHSRLLDNSHILDNGSTITDSNPFTFISLILKSLVHLLSQWLRTEGMLPRVATDDC